MKAPTSVTERHRAESESALPLPTTGLSDAQRASLEVAESARDAADDRASFAAGLFLGRYERDRLHPFPVQDEHDRAVGDDLVGRVSALLAARLDPETVDETRSIPAEVVEGLQDLGVFRMKVPTEYGGLGLSQVNYNRVLMAIASHCASTAVLVSAHQSIGIPQPLKMFGTEAQKAQWFRRIVNGEITGFALTEPGVGSDPARMTTTATRRPDGSWRLDGLKLWTTNGPIAGALVVMARTVDPSVADGGRARITAFLVDTDQAGVEVVHRCDFMGLRAIQNGVLRFTDVHVPAENVIWGEGLGLKLALRTLNTGRLTLPAACTGLGKQCLRIARHWGAEREQWGLAIGRHEAGRQKIADIAATTFAMEAVTWLTSHWADAGREIRIEAAMAKLFCSEAAWRLVDVTMALRGGRGYERAISLRERGETPFPVERMMRDCRINTIIEGTSDIMRLFLAREALDPHLKRAIDVLRPGTPLPRRLRAAAGMAGHYARWYPARLAGTLVGRGGGPLAAHHRFIDRASDRLAAALFGAMARHGQRLERRQVILGRLMDIGTELFAMSAACAYAARGPRGAAAGEATALADVFCRQARVRIREHRRGLRSDVTKRANRVAGDVLDGRYRWLERGIIPAGKA